MNKIIEEAPLPQAPSLNTKAQKECKVLKKLVDDDHKHQLTVKTIEDRELVYYNNKIYIPPLLSKAFVK